MKKTKRKKPNTSRSQAEINAQTKKELYKTPGGYIQTAGKTNVILSGRMLTDNETGEQIPVTDIRKEIFGDKNFYKVWLADLLGLIESLAKGKLKIIFYFIDKMRTNENIIIAGTIRDIAKATKTSTTTVGETLQYMTEKDIVRIIGRGVYQLNPNLLFKGGHNKRTSLLITYKNLETIDLTKDKQLTIEE